MKTYCGCGILKEIPYFVKNTEEFQIQEFDTDVPDKYVYPNDSIKYSLDNELASLYDTLVDLFFEDKKSYYEELKVLPIWVQEAGQNSDYLVSAEMFQELIQSDYSVKFPNLYKHLYLVDCQFLVGTVQNLLSSMEDAFIRYYVTLATLDCTDRHKELVNSNGIIFEQSETSRCAAAVLETYFIKAYSVLDIVCKICFEFQNKNEDFSSYKKLKNAKVLWGDRKKLSINNSHNTLFEKCELVSMIESLRNELVHNGTWELNPKIFIRIEDAKVQERYMLFPDMSQGRLATVKGRKHFFYEEIKVNDVFPNFHIEFKNRLLNTILLLNNRKIYRSE